MTATNTPQAPFQFAWTDLGQRLNSALATLESLAATTPDPKNRERLDSKVTGLNDALNLYGDLAAAFPNDYAGAWRTFAAQVTTLLDIGVITEGYYQGVNVALSYQKGYGADVDA